MGVDISLGAGYVKGLDCLIFVLLVCIKSLLRYFRDGSQLTFLLRGSWLIKEPSYSRGGSFI